MNYMAQANEALTKARSASNATPFTMWGLTALICALLAIADAVRKAE